MSQLEPCSTLQEAAGFCVFLEGMGVNDLIIQQIFHICPFCNCDFLEDVEIDALIFQNCFRHFHATPLLCWHRFHTFRPKRFFLFKLDLSSSILTIWSLGQRGLCWLLCLSPLQFLSHSPDITFAHTPWFYLWSPQQTRTGNEPRPGHLKDEWCRKKAKSTWKPSKKLFLRLSPLVLW